MKKNKVTRIFAITLAAISLLAISISAFAATTAQTNVGSVNIRKEPKVSSKLVGQVAKGTTFTVDKEVTGQTLNGSDVWLEISNIKCASGSKHNITGQSGYVHSSFVSGYSVSGGGSGNDSPTPTGAHTSKNSVNVREYPNTGSKRLGQVAINTTLKVLGEAEGESLNGSTVWLNVTILKCAPGSANQINGTTGYIHSSFVAGYTVGTTSSQHPQNANDAFGYSTLKYGSKGNYVRNLQLCLIDGGFLDDSAKVDGIFGAKTTAAVKAFQRKYSYLLVDNEYDDPADGLVGLKTRNALWYIFSEYLKEHGVM